MPTSSNGSILMRNTSHWWGCPGAQCTSLVYKRSMQQMCKYRAPWSGSSLGYCVFAHATQMSEQDFATLKMHSRLSQRKNSFSCQSDQGIESAESSAVSIKLSALWTSLRSSQCWVERLICGLGICRNPIFLVVILRSPIRQIKTCTFFCQSWLRQCNLQWNKIMNAQALLDTGFPHSQVCHM